MVENETLLESWSLVLVGLSVPELGELGQEGFVGSFRDNTLFIQAGQDTDRLIESLCELEQVPCQHGLRGLVGIVNNTILSYVGIFDELNGWLQILTKVHILPLNVLAFILILFQDKHMVVEELLEFLVRVIDTELLKAVDLKT